jgi:hypothetical protein
MECLHNQPEEQTALQVVELLLLNYLHHLIILTEQVQIILLHLATGVVGVIAEQVEEVEDLVAVEEVAAEEEEDSELNLKTHYT